MRYGYVKSRGFLNLTSSHSGQTNINSERKNIVSGRCDFLVATPGRLIDHLQNTPGFATKLRNLRVLVLDEGSLPSLLPSLTPTPPSADMLLEMGFRPDITRILGYLPKERQTLLFSATVPKEIKDIATLALRPQYSLVDTVVEGIFYHLNMAQPNTHHTHE